MLPWKNDGRREVASYDLVSGMTNTFITGKGSRG